MSQPGTFDAFRALPDPAAHVFETSQGDPLGALLTRATPGDIATAALSAEGPLAGLPIGIKDNLCTRDLPTTAASRILEGYRSPFDATVVERLRAAGALIVAKTNLDEFAMGSTGQHSAFKPTLHPLSPTHSPGGSSSGSAAAVAAGWLPAALGSDTGGSLRQPAATCGLVGFKPTYGRVSRHGLIAFASSLDHIGWLTRSVADAALLFDVLAGPDPRDPSALRDAPLRASAQPTPRIPALRLGLLPALIEDTPIHPAISRAFSALIEGLRSAGATLPDLSPAHLELAGPTYTAISSAEAASNLARYEGLRFGQRASGPSGAPSTVEAFATHTRSALLGAEVQRRLLLGHSLLSGQTTLANAQNARAHIRKNLDEALTHVDALLTPTTPDTAPRRDAPDDPEHHRDRFTLPANLAGLPAISLPLGHDADGLPFGLQLIGRRGHDAHLLAIARALEAFLTTA
ncbi:Asp-tRNA(Asn)/Glu-tRNA(Gln) amidotransferase subunit GatA [Bradymonadaceae bacterium TMQ3]|nr:Asp-tRNA(Asn)/Glu-tRNA(Gln) amidotransferase subunit GatA [Bradymonadaceae bacterium TMQ3]TXC69412.1 Asp-tRNA(Asn)/Glu-tRNA(Gln) amidotransferase subunit GatA [Bradymonadales bacterium TMQ1]